MNIFINARFLSQSLTGVQRVATEFVKALDYLIETKKIDETKYSFVLLAPKNIQIELNLKHIQLKKSGDFYWSFMGTGGIAFLCETWFTAVFRQYRTSI
jgi:hypothetical protein